MPLIVTNLFQALYNIVDMMIVGKYAGAAGLSAVTIGGQVTQVILCVVLGISNAGAVMIAQLAGAKRQNEIPRTLGTMIVTFFVIAMVLTVSIILFTDPLLRLLNTPQESFGQTVSYLRICMIGTVFIYFYNLMSGVLRGVGNSRTPMLLVLFSLVLNIFLDWLFVGVFNKNAAGAAVATVIAQVVCAGLIIIYMFRETDFVVWDKSLFCVDRQKLNMLLKIGLPQSVQFTLTNLSFLFIAGLVNTYGVYASAATGAAGKLSSFAVLSGQAVMGAIITMSAQNIAAQKYKRALQGMGMGILYALPLSVVFYILSFVQPEKMLGLFTQDPQVLAVGGPYLQIVAVSFVIESVMFCMMGVLTGAGYTNITMICAIISAFGVRYGLAWFLSSVASMGFLGIAMAYPFAPLSSTVICLVFILSGKWKKNRVKI